MSNPDELLGILNIDKPPGVTSREVVNVVQREARRAKVGHAGTLDPLATGVLLVCVGKATRLIDYLQRQRKTYRASFLLGRRSETEDVEGDVETLPASRIPEQPEITDILPKFVGTIRQRPPRFSALKVGGRRAYQMARRGLDFDLAEREVEIHALQLIEYSYPRLDLQIECGSGTYVRSLGRDLAIKLGTEAVMAELARTAIGPFSISESLSMEKVRRQPIRPLLLDCRLAVSSFAPRVLLPEEVARFSCGVTLPTPETPIGTEWTVSDPEGRFVGVAVQVSPRELRPLVNLIARN